MLPFHQRKGYGKFLINFSYELSIIDEKIGSPEKPLSDLGRETYLSYWTQKIVEVIEKQPDNLSIFLISQQTYISEEDVKWTLCKYDLIKMSHGEIVLCVDKNIILSLKRLIGRPVEQIDPDRIHYVPYIIIQRGPSDNEKLKR